MQGKEDIKGEGTFPHALAQLSHSYQSALEEMRSDLPPGVRVLGQTRLVSSGQRIVHEMGGWRRMEENKRERGLQT